MELDGELEVSRILDKYFVPYREKDEYSEGTYQTVKAVVSVVAKEYGISSIGEVSAKLADEIEQKHKEAEEKDTEDKQLSEYLNLLKTRPELKMLFNLTKDATREEVEKAVKIIETILGK